MPPKERAGIYLFIYLSNLYAVHLPNSGRLTNCRNIYRKTIKKLKLCKNPEPWGQTAWEWGLLTLSTNSSGELELKKSHWPPFLQLPPSFRVSFFYPPFCSKPDVLKSIKKYDSHRSSSFYALVILCTSVVKAIWIWGPIKTKMQKNICQ